MGNFKEMKSLFRRYGKDEKGNMALTMSLSTVVILSAMGAAVDYSVVANADSRAQSIADSSALAAAIHVKNHGSKPKNKSEGLVGSYTAKELGYDVSGWVRNGAEGVEVDIVYDDEALEARVVVEGKTKPTFSQIMGHENLKFKASATVKYSQVELKNPASIALVLDSSGSMAWDDRVDPVQSNDEFESSSRTPNAISRNESLKLAASSFMDRLEPLERGSNGKRVVRTGLYAYNSRYQAGLSKPMKWGALSTGKNSKLNRLPASGGTNSSSAMVEVVKDFVKEDQRHKNESGDGNPFKYVVLMTDGANNETHYGAGGCQTFDRPRHKHWRYTYQWFEGWYSYYEYSHSRFKPRHQPGRYQVEDWKEIEVGPGFDQDRTCEYTSAYDTATVAACQALATQGVKVFTIGYGLEPGYYHMRSSSPRDYEVRYDYTIYERYHVEIKKPITDRAYNMLQSCAEESGGKFYRAKDAAELEKAFDNIGSDIINEVIRLSN